MDRHEAEIPFEWMARDRMRPQPGPQPADYPAYFGPHFWVPQHHNPLMVRPPSPDPRYQVHPRYEVPYAGLYYPPPARLQPPARHSMDQSRPHDANGHRSGPPEPQPRGLADSHGLSDSRAPPRQRLSDSPDKASTGQADGKQQRLETKSNASTRASPLELDHLCNPEVDDSPRSRISDSADSECSDLSVASTENPSKGSHQPQARIARLPLQDADLIFPSMHSTSDAVQATSDMHPSTSESSRATPYSAAPAPAGEATRAPRPRVPSLQLSAIRNFSAEDMMARLSQRCGKYWKESQWRSSIAPFLNGIVAEPTRPFDGHDEKNRLDGLNRELRDVMFANARNEIRLLRKLRELQQVDEPDKEMLSPGLSAPPPTASSWRSLAPHLPPLDGNRRTRGDEERKRVHNSRPPGSHRLSSSTLRKEMSIYRRRKEFDSCFDFFCGASPNFRPATPHPPPVDKAPPTPPHRRTAGGKREVETVDGERGFEREDGTRGSEITEVEKRRRRRDPRKEPARGSATSNTVRGSANSNAVRASATSNAARGSVNSNGVRESAGQGHRRTRSERRTKAHGHRRDHEDASKVWIV